MRIKSTKESIKIFLKTLAFTYFTKVLIYFVYNLGFDAGLSINFQQANKLQFPEITLVDNYKIATFLVPVYPPFGIEIPGTLSLSLKANLALTMYLEKAIDFKLSYSKHIVFALPFLYKNGKMNYPNPSNMFNIYGSQNLNPDFSQFKQIPKFGAAFSLIPGLTIRWPDFGLGKAAQIKALPGFLKIPSITVRKRGILDDLRKFFQLSLTNEVPLVITGKISTCTSNCKTTKPLEISIQGSIGPYIATLSGLGLQKSFEIPIPLTTPAFSFCLPFLNICPKVKENSILKIASTQTCNDYPCKNSGNRNEL